MALGTSATLWLLPGPRVVGRVTFDIQTLLFACMTIAIGFQAVLFSILGKVFAWNEGLLPVGDRFKRMFRYVTLEAGLAAGLLSMLAGAAGAIYAFVRWSEVSFGALDVSQALRIAIPSLTALLLGAQTILASFFLSLLGIRRRRSAGPNAMESDHLGTLATQKID
jgi:hypothetical protein